MANFAILKGVPGVLKIIILVFELISVGLAWEAIIISSTFIEAYYLGDTLIAIVISIFFIVFFFFCCTFRTMLTHEMWRNAVLGVLVSISAVIYTAHVFTYAHGKKGDNGCKSEGGEGQCSQNSKYSQRVAAGILGAISGVLHCFIGLWICYQRCQLPEEVHENGSDENIVHRQVKRRKFNWLQRDPYPSSPAPRNPAPASPSNPDPERQDNQETS